MRRCDQMITRKVFPREAGNSRSREKRNISKGDLEARVRSETVLHRERYHNRFFLFLQGTRVGTRTNNDTIKFRMTQYIFLTANNFARLNSPRR